MCGETWGMRESGTTALAYICLLDIAVRKGSPGRQRSISRYEATVGIISALVPDGLLEAVGEERSETRSRSKSDRQGFIASIVHICSSETWPSKSAPADSCGPGGCAKCGPTSNRALLGSPRLCTFHLASALGVSTRAHPRSQMQSKSDQSARRSNEDTIASRQG